MKHNCESENTMLEQEEGKIIQCLGKVTLKQELNHISYYKVSVS